MSENAATRMVVISHPTGLCLRGATAIAKTSRQFQSKIEIAKQDRRVHATDVLQVVSLGAGQGTSLVLEAAGPDAEEALDALVELFESNFGLEG